MYRRRLAVALGVCILGLSGLGATAVMGHDPVEGEGQRVLAVDDEWVAAEVNREEAVLRRVIDDRFVFNANDGRTSNKATLIENVLGGKMTGQTVSERTVLVDGRAAIVCGTVELRFASEGGEERKSLLRYTATYVKRGKQWRALALHMARHTGGR